MYLNKNRFDGNEICCAGDNYNHMSNIFAEKFLDTNFGQAVSGKISIFQDIVPNFTYSQKLNFYSVIRVFFKPTTSIL